VPVIPIPGPSSLMTAISLSPLPIKEFYYAGFLPRKKDIRKSELNRLRKFQIPIILMDTPYRLPRLLSEVVDTFGKGRSVTLVHNLTLPSESIMHDTAEQVFRRYEGKKGEFILIVHR
jgi:16S rRNA (cytidine1402-2'-O)-methyltransferase